MRRVLLDAGPLVALLYPRDAAHARCSEVWRQIDPPLLTCWPVLAEAAWLLRADPSLVEDMLTKAAAGLFTLLPLDERDTTSIAAILARYRDLKPQLAGAALVHLAERENISTIFTLDRRDFAVFRIRNRRHFRIVP